MRIVTANELQDWLRQGELLEKDSRGPKVVRLANGQLLKIFYSRRLPLIDRLLPPAKRFARHAERLQALDIRTPEIIECCWIDHHQGISACLYRPLAGTALDRLYTESRAVFDAQLPALAAYIHHLHQRGIYFRSLHLGNVLLTPDQGFGLIDFLDIRFKGRPLSRTMIRRNFNHLQNYLERRRVQDFPWEQLLRCYAEAGGAHP